VRIAADGTQMLQLALSERVDLVVLDLGLPELDELELCRRLECKVPRALGLIVTARSTELDRVLGLGRVVTNHIGSATAPPGP